MLALPFDAAPWRGPCTLYSAFLQDQTNLTSILPRCHCHQDLLVLQQIVEILPESSKMAATQIQEQFQYWL